MIGKARHAGLVFDDAAIQGHPLRKDPLGTLHDSKTGLYRVTPGIDRPIGRSTIDPKHPSTAPKQDDPTQSVHESVRARWDGDATYRPASLRDYFKRTGDPRGEER